MIAREKVKIKVQGDLSLFLSVSYRYISVNPQCSCQKCRYSIYVSEKDGRIEK